MVLQLWQLHGTLVRILDFVLVASVNTLDLKHVRMSTQLVISTLRDDLPFVHDDNFVGQVHEFGGMSHQDSCSVLEQALEDLIKDLLSSVCVQS